MSSTCSFLEMYEPLDVIGNGSFGIIRKVRRKNDGMIYARKELNFEKMSERDRKQIVAEVNILKDLHHEHIVRYIDRHVDREAGILYILMEYCGGGDLSTVIKQAAKHNRPIPEDTIWNYFMQILLALHHCHHPNGHTRSSSGGGSSGSSGGVVGVTGDACSASAEGNFGTKRAQILHRDLKPDNVFLNEINCVKLGDFGLSKALAQASFANTYVGTPYYMSPELMQEKAYDTKSDIWSLGCLIYELCALKPPFHEAKTHAELSICIRNGRIPPLPRGYSQALSNVIKSMLSLNPAMRPSAAQLLQHERLELVFKVSETEKMLATVKAHKAAVTGKERELLTREATLHEKEKHLEDIIAKKDAELVSMQRHMAEIQKQTEQRRYTQQDIELAIRSAVAKREEELRVAVMQREEEVKMAMAKREEEILDAVRKREMEVSEAWTKREAEIAKEVQARIQEVEQRADAIRRREDELKAEEVRLNNVRVQLEDKLSKWDETSTGRKEKTPLEEVKNLLTPLARGVSRRVSKDRVSFDSMATPRAAPVPAPHLVPPIETPESRAMFGDYIPSAMKGVVLTSTGEVLETPTPTELANIFKISPKVGLNFAKIFDFGGGADGKKQGIGGVNGLDISCSSGEEEVTPPPSPSSRKEKERLRRGKSDISNSGSSSSSSSNSNRAPSAAGSAVSAASSTSTSNPPSKKAQPQSAQPATRLRKPSIRTSAASARTALTRTATAPVVFGSAPNTTATGTVKKASASKPVQKACAAESSKRNNGHKPEKEKHGGKENEDSDKNTIVLPPPPRYDLDDEDNLPSPFLKRADRGIRAAGDLAARFIEDNEENLPSPFLKRAERERTGVVAFPVASTNQTKAGAIKEEAGGATTTASSSSSSSSSSSADLAPSGAVAGGTVTATSSAAGPGPGTVTKSKRPSSGNMLRAMAAANNAASRRSTTTATAATGGPSSPTRSSTARAAQIQSSSCPRPNLGGLRRLEGGAGLVARS